MTTQFSEKPRTQVTLARNTKETQISLSLNLEATGQVQIETGLPFFNHLLEQLAFHGQMDIQLKATGDLDIDDHHLIEDVAIVLGLALDELRQHRPGMARYGQRLLPMDGTLILCAVDLCGRAASVVDLPFTREKVGGVATEMWPHFFKTLATKGQFSLHLKTQYFDNHHHLIEGSFKALARSLREALTLERSGVASTKGVL
jgi:imidazoleglycerol-phosphate dehydratase